MSDRRKNVFAAVKAALGFGPRVVYSGGNPRSLTQEARLEAAMRAIFERHATEWERKSEHMSVVRDMIALPEYRLIIKFGSAVVPFIIERMQTKPSVHWFAALKEIVGEDVTEGAMTVQEAKRRWIEWYDSGGYANWLAARDQKKH